MRVLVALLCAVVLSIGASTVLAATQLWEYELGQNAAPIELSADQLVADGSGGCVIIWKEYNNDTSVFTAHVARFSAKGVQLWKKTYVDVWDAEFGYVDKKLAVYSLSPDNSGDKYVCVVDSKGIETRIDEVGAHVSCDLNGEIGPTADKKGFYVIVENAADAVILRRYSYK